MRKLLEVYKKCRYMDRLMNTSFFHEDKFQGLIERVRRVSTTTITVGRVLDHKSRLFNDTHPSPAASTANSITTSTPGRIKSKVCLQGDQEIQTEQIICETELETLGTSSDDDDRKLAVVSLKPIDVTVSGESGLSDFDATATPPPPPGTNEAAFGSYPSKLFGFVMNNIDNASKETDDLCRWSTNHPDTTYYCQHHASKSKSNSNSADSGNHTKTEWGENSCASEVINTSVSLAIKPNSSADDHTSNSCCSIDMTSGEDLPKCGCARLCALIKAQLVMALKEINERFSQVNNSLSDAVVVEESTMSLVTDDAPLPPVPLTKEMLDNCLDTTDELLMPDSTSGEEADSSSCVSSTAVIAPLISPSDCFIVLESAPQSHTYQLTLFQPLNAQLFYRTVRFDHKLLQTALPPGVWVR